MRDGLTRREIGWLLAQEARGAAQALRRGIELKIRESLPPPATSDEIPKSVNLAPPSLGGFATLITESSGPPSAPVGTLPTTPLLDSLSALDDAIGMLGDLQARSGSKRRGRIDLAALLYELSPKAKITISAGLGTEVAGEEEELRRMLQLLLAEAGQGRNHEALELEVGREDGMIFVTAELGPDAAMNAGLERRWLNRMAMRFGGRLEMRGGGQTLLLPAEGIQQQAELNQLRTELAQAQELGEAYARELATVLTSAEERLPSIGPEPSETLLSQIELVSSLSHSIDRRTVPLFVSGALDACLLLPREEAAERRELGSLLEGLGDGIELEIVGSSGEPFVAPKSASVLLRLFVLAASEAASDAPLKLTLSSGSGSLDASLPLPNVLEKKGFALELATNLAAHLGGRLTAKIGAAGELLLHVPAGASLHKL